MLRGRSLKTNANPVKVAEAWHGWWSPNNAYDQYDTGTANRDAKYDGSDPHNLSRLDDE